MSRPFIGITTWRRTLPTDEGYSTDLDTNAFAYQRAIADLGGVPVLLPHINPDYASDYLDHLDGLVVSGGDDVDPAAYGGTPQDYRHDPSRDAHEANLLRGARERGIPTLGICRGLQIAAVSFGGSLNQDISRSADHPGAVGAAELLVRHHVNVAKGSRLAGMIGKRALVNSTHHQAVLDPGDLRAVAHADDGVVEAAESTGDWWFVGVQWHPEFLFADSDRASAALFSAFLDQGLEFTNR